MPQLNLSQYEFIECLEVLPTVEEGQIRHLFTVARGGITLELTLWQYESIVQFALRSGNASDPLIEFAIVVRGAAGHLKVPGGLECLEFTDCLIVPDRFSYVDYQRVRLDVYDSTKMPGVPTIRLFVKPSISIKLPRAPRPL
jgi:hypothetical protein